MSDLANAWGKFNDALAIREYLCETAPGTEGAIGSVQFADHHYALLAGHEPQMIQEAKMLIDALDADVGETGDATTAAIVRSLASFFSKLATKADEGEDAFIDAMIAAGRLANADQLLKPTSVPVVHRTSTQSEAPN